MDLSLIQWPAMVVNILSVWLLTSQSRHKRHAGFVLSLVSNALRGSCGASRPSVCSAWSPGCAGHA